MPDPDNLVTGESSDTTLESSIDNCKNILYWNFKQKLPMQ
jgi:hypothetical protein